MRGRDLEFSILIRTRDRLASLRRTLRSLERLDHPREAFEVIVVDDGSRDGTGEWLAERALQSPLPLRVVRQSPRGLASANNAALRAARGRRLVFVDDDCSVPPEWLDVLHDGALRLPNAVLCGPIHNGCPDNFYAEATLFLLNAIQELSRRPDGSLAFSFSVNTAYPRAAAALTGDFDDRYDGAAAEERDWNLRMQRAGISFVALPELPMEHRDPLSLRRFWSTHVRYGRGAARFYEAHDSAIRLGPGRGARLMGLALRRYPFPRNLAILGLLVVSQAATALGYGLERRRPRPRERAITSGPSRAVPGRDPGRPR